MTRPLCVPRSKCQTVYELLNLVAISLLDQPVEINANVTSLYFQLKGHILSGWVVCLRQFCSHKVLDNMKC